LPLVRVIVIQGESTEAVQLHDGANAATCNEPAALFMSTASEFGETLK
jgi:hypothetical protein